MVFVTAIVTTTNVPCALAVNPEPLETDWGVSTLTNFTLKRLQSHRRTADSGGQRNSSGPISSIGFAKPKRLRGRSFSSVATHSRSIALCCERSVPLGKYWRSSPLVFSLVARCHGACGSQK